MATFFTTRIFTCQKQNLLKLNFACCCKYRSSLSNLKLSKMQPYLIFPLFLFHSKNPTTFAQNFSNLCYKSKRKLHGWFVIYLLVSETSLFSLVLLSTLFGSHHQKQHIALHNNTNVRNVSHNNAGTAKGTWWKGSTDDWRNHKNIFLPTQSDP